MASSNGDILRLHQSTKGEDNRLEFDVEEKQFIDLNDTNGLNYDGQSINFDGNAARSNSEYTDWAQSYIAVPITLSVTCATIATDVSNILALSLKQGYWQIFDGFTVVCENQTLINRQSMSNIAINYEFLSKINKNDEDALAATNGWTKDNGESIRISAALGEVNNRCGPWTSAGATASVEVPGTLIYNEARAKRIRSTITSLDDPWTQSFVTENQVISEQRSYCKRNGTTLTYNIMANIMLKDLHPLFKELPLQKMALWRFTFHTHLPATHTIAWTNATAGNEPTWTAGSGQTNSPNGFCPFMITAPCAQNGAGTNPSGFALTAGAGSMTVSMGIGWASTVKSCTMRLCQTRLSAQARSAYVADPLKVVIFRDFLTCRPIGITGTNPGDTVNCNLTAGVARPRAVTFFAYFTEGGTAFTGSALNSPYTSCGGTTRPGGFLGNFNLFVGAKNMFRQNFIRSGDLWLQQEAGVNGNSGNLIPGMTSGFLNEKDYREGYGIIHINMERHAQENDNVATSIDVTFTNTSTRKVSFIAFVHYEKEITMNVETGQLAV